MKSVLGIDLGTMNSVAAYLPEGEDEPILVNPRAGATSQGLVFPSFVEFNAAGEPVRFCGDAYDRWGSMFAIVRWGAKRLLGLNYEEAKRELEILGYPGVSDPDGKVMVVTGARLRRPEEIASMILQKIRDDTEYRDLNPIGEGLSRVVVTYPAYFPDLRIDLTREAAKQVFHMDVEMAPEPVAAALSYGFEFPVDESRIVMVIDWGAGTLDIVVAKLFRDRAGKLKMEPKPAVGHTHLGGIDMDKALVKAQSTKCCSCGGKAQVA